MNAYSYMTILKKKIKIKVYNKDSLGSLILVSEYFYRLDEWHRIGVYIDDTKDRDRIVCSNLLRYIESLVNLKLCQSNASTLCISHPKIIFFTLMLRIFFRNWNYKAMATKLQPRCEHFSFEFYYCMCRKCFIGRIKLLSNLLPLVGQIKENVS